MTSNQTKRTTMIFTAVSSAVIGWAIVRGRPEIIIVTFTALLLFKYLSGKQANPREITSDELVTKITDKAARVSFSIFGIVASLVGAILMALDKKGPFYYAGFTLSMAVAVLLLLNSFFLFYYRRKYYDQE